MRRFAPGLALFVTACSVIADTGEVARPGASPTDPTAPNAPSSPPESLPPATPLHLVAPPFDVSSTAAALDAWPRLFPGVFSRATTSFDRSGGNDDGFTGTYSELYVDARGEHVVFDESGPGVVRTLWFASIESGDRPLALGLVRFYFDDEDKPRIEIDADTLFAGGKPPFVAPLVAANTISSGGFASWAPLPYRSRLRITTERRAAFYQAHFDTLPPDWDVRSYAPGTSDAALSARFANAASPSDLPLTEVPLDTTESGAATIDVLRFVPSGAPSDTDLRAAKIQITFDGAAQPQVDLPLDFFFGSALGVAPVHALFWTMENGLLESRLPMPYFVSAHIVVSGIAGKLSLHKSAPPSSQAETGTFEARFREETPASNGQDFVYADVTGAGKLVATVLGVDPVVASTKRWWEGDLRCRVDGARTPSIHGTGHEDDHLGGWSNEFFSRPFSLPMQGAPRTDLLDTGAEFQKNGKSSMYRLWPGITFEQSIRHSTEHGTGNTIAANYAAATFLYRQPAVRSVRTDAFDVGDTDAASAHAYAAPDHVEAVLTSAFEGDSDAVATTVLHEYASPATFTLAIAPNNDGVVLRRMFDRSEAPLQSTLDVDGVRIRGERTFGPVAGGRVWAERDVFVPAQVTQGKSQVTVRWVPDTSPKAAGAPARRPNAARFEAWTITRP